ncbi:MAG: heparinase II/III family protein [Bacteroidales bacterium]|nr:heparinase II/III family protein [Bacteroidales bacterium]
MKRILLFAAFTLLLGAEVLQAREDRHLFRNAYDAIPNKAAVFRPGGAWFPYPAYEDRAAWEQLTAPFREELIAQGEKALGHKWKMVPASAYLEYEKTGDRDIVIEYDYVNRDALRDLLLAELAEGKGRFVMQLVDGLFYTCERATWSHMQHTRNQDSHRTLPDPDQRVISLLSANMAAQVAVTWHFLHGAFDKLDPSISSTVLHALDANIFSPYLDPARDKNHGWLGFKGKKVNNWNTYCNTHVLLAFLLCEPGPERLLAALAKATDSVDKYMDSVSLDGACDEGPSYWNMAGGKVYEFAHILRDASGGRLDLLRDGQIRRMGEFKSQTYIGDGWVLDFADGEPRDPGDPFHIWRFGRETGSRQMMDMALNLLAQPETGTFSKPSFIISEEQRKYRFGEVNDLYRFMENLRCYNDMVADEKQAVETAGGDFGQLRQNLRKSATSVFYEGTEVAALRNGAGWFLGVKGGNNGESHNHNDVGSGVLYIDDCPVLIDAGVGTYAKATFGPDRYTLWYMQSDWHNAPGINGFSQKDGREFHASGTSCDLNKRSFSTDLAAAYPDGAACKSWNRTWTLGEDKMTLVDRFRLTERKGADAERFLTRGQAFLPGQDAAGYKVPDGEVVLLCKSFDGQRSVRIRIAYPATLKAKAETLELTDARLKRSWGSTVCRVSFVSGETAPLSGSYAFTLSRF